MSGCLDGEEFLLLSLLWKPLNFSFDSEWLPRLENFWLASFSFSNIPISCHSLLTCKVSAKNLLIALWDFLCIEEVAFIFLFLRFYLYPLLFYCNYNASNFFLFGFILFAIFWSFWTWISVSFHRFRKFSALICSNNFSGFLSLLFLWPQWCRYYSAWC